MMGLFHSKKKDIKKKQETGGFDRERQIPVLRASICTGEKVAGFRDKDTGKFEEVMLISGKHDLDEFMETYGISEAEIKKEW